MSKQILVNSSHYETRVATLENGEIRALHIERNEDRNVVGNVYKGLVKRVLPGMQAAFLELGLERTAFLYVDDIIDDPFGTDVEVEEEDSEDGDYDRDGDEGYDTDGDADSDPEYGPEDPRDAAEDATDTEGSAAADDRDPRDTPPRGPRDPQEAREPREPRDPRDTRPEEGRPADVNRNGDRDAEHDRDRPPARGRGPETRGRGGRGGGGGGRDAGGRGRRPQQRRGGRTGGRRPLRREKRSANIQDLLKEGQEILVQVAKAPIGTKGARLTTHISLPGRNLVLMPTVKHVGISRRISSDRERRRLRDLFTRKIGYEGVGFIIRTVADGKSLKELKADTDYLMKMWERIKEQSGRKRAPALIHEDLSLALRTVRDFFTEEVDQFIIDDPGEYEVILDFIDHFMPRLKSRVKLFKGPSQLFEHYGIEAEISRALGKKVWLKSGGYLLIDQSEALTAIDVNTGRYVGSKSLEETIFKTNLEAVKEVAYQLRIRNVGGIIIIDLIDMENQGNREKVYHELQEALGEDRARTNILKISELGLVEMTRKRTHEDLVRYLTESCSNCDGRGYHKSRRTVCFEIFREIEKEALHDTKNIVVFAHPDVTAKMLAEEKEHVEKLEQRFTKHILVRPDPTFHVEQFEVFGKN